MPESFGIRQNCCIFINMSIRQHLLSVSPLEASQSDECVCEWAKTRGRYHILRRKRNTATKHYLKYNIQTKRNEATCSHSKHCMSVKRTPTSVCTANRKKTTIHKEIIDYCPPLRIRLPQNDDDTEKFGIVSSVVCNKIELIYPQNRSKDFSISIDPKFNCEHFVCQCEFQSQRK